MSEPMEKICKNCKHNQDLMSVMNTEGGRCFNKWLKDAWYYHINHDTCSLFDPIQEDNKEER